MNKMIDILRHFTKYPNSCYFQGLVPEEDKEDTLKGILEFLKEGNGPENQNNDAVAQAKRAGYCEGAKDNVRRYPATEYKGRVFKIYREVKDPYDNQKPESEIELSEGVYLGGDLYIVPMQVFKTDNPAILKVVFMIAGGCNSMPYSSALQSEYGEITDNNIRTALMTWDKKLYYHNGALDCEGVYDLAPQPWRLD